MEGQEQNLWVVDINNEAVEVRELMNSRHIDDHKLAISALTGWIRHREGTTEAPAGFDYSDRHHFYNRKAGKGQPFAGWRQQPENIITVRRDLHQETERIFGWLNKPLKEEVMVYLQPESRAA